MGLAPQQVGEDARDGSLSRQVALTWVVVLGVLAPFAAWSIGANFAPKITARFLLSEDMPLLALQSAILAVACWAALRLAGGRVGALDGLARRHAVAACAGLAVLAGVAALVGWHTVYQQYPLTKDEYWASFDAEVFAHGKLLAPVAEPWRALAAAMQPPWRLEIAGNTAWASSYLPLNAAFRALGSRLGSPALAGAVWAALSIVALFALARRWWPDRPDAALVAAILLASSAQFLVAAMSPYAVSAHLALNLVWLWCFQRRGAASQAASIAIAFAATGLHQLVFHPLFAAPFVLQLWLQRRWRLAVLQTGAYALVVGFWASYWGLLLPALGLHAAAASGAGAANFAHRALDVLAAAQPAAAPGLMADNLLRLVAWQNPLMIVLALSGAAWGVRARDPRIWPLAAGVVLTATAMMVVQPFQGHGWGYRYLHGLLGSLALIAAAGWVRLTASSQARRGGWAAMAGATLLCVLVTLPVCFFDAYGLIRPYARAEAAIRRSAADVVLVDTTGLVYGEDLVRNDPFLTNRPKLVALSGISDAEALALCRTDRVAIFDRHDAETLGVPPSGAPASARVTQLRTLLVGTPPVSGAGAGAPSSAARRPCLG